MSRAAAAFRDALRCSNELAREMDQPEFPLKQFLLVQEWQRQRFRETYSDFLDVESNLPACRFFLEQLYGGLGFRERDEDVNRVEPIMSRLLPDHALWALSEALQLQIISLELDRAMAIEALSRNVLTMESVGYAEIYRACGHRKERKQQIEWIRKLGQELKTLTGMPLLLGLVKAVRRPALAAGYGRLQGFLEDGLSAFRQLDDPISFVAAIFDREQNLMERWFAGESPEFGISVSR